MSSNRKINRDHAKKKQRPMVEDEVIAFQLEQLLTPAIITQENYYLHMLSLIYIVADGALKMLLILSSGF